MVVALLLAILSGNLLSPRAASASRRPGVGLKSKLVGLTVTEDGNWGRPRRLEWLRLQWRNNTVEGTSAEWVDPRTDSALASHLGGFANIVFDEGFPDQQCTLDASAKRLFCLGRYLNATENIGGCCADSILVYFRDGRAPQVVDLNAALKEEALARGDVSQKEVELLQASHNLFLETETATSLTFLIGLQYSPETLGGARDFGMFKAELSQAADGSLAPTGRIVPTARGNALLLPLRDLGTASVDPRDGVYRIQYDLQGRDFSRQRQSITGVLSLTDTRTGVPMVAFSNLYQSEVVLLTDPWRMALPPRILQRFGTMPIIDRLTGRSVGIHHFGLEKQEEAPSLCGAGMHNPWKTTYHSAGMDTITVLANADTPDTGRSRVYEFVVNINPESGGEEPTDQAFDTSFRRVDLDIGIPNGGGAIPIEVGLYVVASGLNSEFIGLKIVDSKGGILSVPFLDWFPNGRDGLYDPFLMIDDIS